MFRRGLFAKAAAGRLRPVSTDSNSPPFNVSRIEGRVVTEPAGTC